MRHKVSAPRQFLQGCAAEALGRHQTARDAQGEALHVDLERRRGDQRADVLAALRGLGDRSLREGDDELVTADTRSRSRGPSWLRMRSQTCFSTASPAAWP